MAETIVTINGKQYDLAALDEKSGKELFNALEPEAQERVKQRAEFIVNFKAPREVDPAKANPDKLREIYEWVTSGAVKTAEQTKKYAQDIMGIALSDAQVDILLESGSFIGGTLARAADWTLVGPRLIAAGNTGYKSWAGSTDGQPTMDQAIAFAAAYEARAFTATEEVVKGEEPTWFDRNVIARGEWVIDWLSSSAVGKYVRAFIGATGNWFSNEPGGFNFSEQLKQLEIEIAKTPQRTLEQIVEDNQQESARSVVTPQAEADLISLGTVAGLEAEPLISMMQKGGNYAGYDGKIYGLTIDGDTLKITPVPGRNGQTLTDEENGKVIEGQGVTGGLGMNLETAAGAALAAPVVYVQGRLAVKATNAAANLTLGGLSGASEGFANGLYNPGRVERKAAKEGKRAERAIDKTLLKQAGDDAVKAAEALKADGEKLGWNEKRKIRAAAEEALRTDVRESTIDRVKAEAMEELDAKTSPRRAAISDAARGGAQAIEEFGVRVNELGRAARVPLTPGGWANRPAYIDAAKLPSDTVAGKIGHALGGVTGRVGALGYRATAATPGLITSIPAQFMDIPAQIQFGYLQGAVTGTEKRLAAAEEKLTKLGETRSVDPDQVGRHERAANEKYNAKIERAKADVGGYAKDLELHRWGVDAASGQKPKGSLFAGLGNIAESVTHTYDRTLQFFERLSGPQVTADASKVTAEPEKAKPAAAAKTAAPSVGTAPAARPAGPGIIDQAVGAVADIIKPANGVGGAATASAGTKSVANDMHLGTGTTVGNTALKPQPLPAEVPDVATKPASSFVKSGMVVPAPANDLAAGAGGKGVKAAGSPRVGGVFALVSGAISGGVGAYQSGKIEAQEGGSAASIAGAAAQGIVYDYKTRAGLSSAVGIYDFQDGDALRGMASLPEFVGIPTTQYVDASRRQNAIDALIKTNAPQVKAVQAAIPAVKDADTGNIYLDRLMALKEMQSRGVKEVTLAEPPMERVPVIGPLVGLAKMGWNGAKGLLGYEVKPEEDYKGKILYEGATVRERSAKIGGTYTVPGTPIKEAFNTNLALFMMNGGTMEQLKKAAGNDGALGKADEGLKEAAIETKQVAQKAAKPMVAHRVQVGAVKVAPEGADSGLLGSFSLGKMDVMKGDFNPFK